MKDFIEAVSNALNFKYTDIIEVDLVITKILQRISEEEYFKTNFLLKGGTCLIKAYLNYYRFSEDIDFTYRKQEFFEGKSLKKIKKDRSEIINKLGKIVKDISEELNLDFKMEKINERYYHFSGNTMFDLKLYYHSQVLNVEKVIKMEFDLLETILFPPEIKTLSIPTTTQNDDLSFLFPKESEEYTKSIILSVYNIKEIFCEKIRAILTRKTIKSRDFLDTYFILDEFGFNLYEFKEEIVVKTLFTLKTEKFMKNFIEKIDFFISGDFFIWGEEKKLLLREIDEKAFFNFLDRIVIFLNEIIKEIRTQLSLF